MRDRTHSFSWVYLVTAALGFPLLGADGGCGGGGGSTGRDAGTVDVGEPPSDVVAGCELSNGRICPVGMSCPAGDDCNICSCQANGRAVCTQRACRVDAGPPLDVGAARDAGVCDEATCGRNPFGAPNYRCPDGSIGGPTCGVRTDGTCGWYLRACPPAPDAGAGCALPGGGVCALGATCPSPDGCNTCTCTADGRLACTERACAPDAGPGCQLSDGRICPVGMSCPAGDGCNTCTCQTNGRAVCTLRACRVDAGATDVPRDTCIPECPAPPPGCHYEGPISCSPPSCGRLVCADAGTEIRCGAGGGGSFPTFDRSCRASSDCYVAIHQTDCCGNSRAMGINASQRDAFERAEMICQPMYPRCGCPARPPVTDDGMTATFSSMIPVECRSGICTTFVRP